MATTAEPDTTADTATTATTPAETVVVAAPASRSNRGLALAGVIGGAVAVGALLLAGGIAVGAAIPERAPMGIVQFGFPQGGPGGGDATRGDGDRDGRQGAPQQLQLPGQRQQSN